MTECTLPLIDAELEKELKKRTKRSSVCSFPTRGTGCGTRTRKPAPPSRSLSHATLMHISVVV